MLLTKYTFHAMLQNDLPPPTQTASTPRSYSRPFNNFHTPVFCRSATYSIETPCALFQKYRGYTPIVPKSGRRETGAAGSSTCGEVSESRAKEAGRSAETAASIRWLRLRLSSVA